MKELIQTRIGELQVEINKIVEELEELKGSAKGDFTPENAQRLSELKDKLLTFKAGQAELKNLLG